MSTICRIENEGALVGTINREESGYRIVWTDKREGRTVHNVEHRPYPTLEDACQAVKGKKPNAQIVKTSSKHSPQPAKK